MFVVDSDKTLVIKESHSTNMNPTYEHIVVSDERIWHTRPKRAFDSLYDYLLQTIRPHNKNAGNNIVTNIIANDFECIESNFVLCLLLCQDNFSMAWKKFNFILSSKDRTNVKRNSTWLRAIKYFVSTVNKFLKTIVKLSVFVDVIQCWRKLISYFSMIRQRYRLLFLWTLRTAQDK